MTEQRYRVRPRHAGPTPGQVVGPAAAALLGLLLLALVVQPAAFLVRVSGPAPVAAAPAPADPAGATDVASAEPAGGQAAPPRAELDDPPPPADLGAEALEAVSGLLRDRDEAVRTGRPDGWTESVGGISGDAADDAEDDAEDDAADDATDDTAQDATDVTADDTTDDSAGGVASPDGSPSEAPPVDGAFAVLASLPVTRFESSVQPGSVRAVDDPVAGEDVEVLVDTLYALAGSEPVVRTDAVLLDAPSSGEGWRVLSWQPYPSLGDVGTAAPWDLGPVHASVGERGVVLTWLDPGAGVVEDARAWGGRVAGWVDEGAVVVDSYLGTGWPRTTLVLAPATTAQYEALVPGPAPDRPDVFAAVTTDVRTEDGGGDVVVLNPTAREELVQETWQVTVTHELVHVASGARYGDGQEVWLAEGVADLVGWSSVVPATAGREQVAGRLLERVADGGADVQELPGATDFAAADADVVGDAYEGAWLAALLLQDELGVEGLLAVYEDASDGPGTARQRTDDALRTATGEGREAFQARWSAYVTGLAAGR